MRDVLWAWMLGLLVAGCKQQPPPDTDSTDPVVDTDETDTVEDSDSDVFETGWGDHTGGPSDTDPGGDTVVPPPDSAPCPFGEVADCDGNCYPMYFIGDGTCDDGSAFQSNFDCAVFGYDGGDCSGDTDGSGPIARGCEYTVRMIVRTYASESGWQIKNATGRVIYDVPPGTYTTNNRDYFHAINLTDGNYTFVMVDSYGDGWHGGTFEVIDPRTRQILTSGGLTTGRLGERPFTTSCGSGGGGGGGGTADCGTVELEVATQQWGFEIGWEIQDEQGAMLAEMPFGRYGNFQTYIHTTDLEDGRYLFIAKDQWGDGWSGGSFRIRELSTGDLLASGTVITGYQSSTWFTVDCAGTGGPVDPPIVDAECDPLKVRLVTGQDGAEVGWELRDAVTGALAAEGAPGSYQSSQTYEVPIAARTGTWRFRLIDTGSDGWQGAVISLVDSTGMEIGSGGAAFRLGSTYTFDVAVECPEVEEPVDTAVCSADTIVDCNGVCWPETYLGDGFCDDGSGFAPNFFCAALQWDRGDCGTP